MISVIVLVILILLIPGAIYFLFIKEDVHKLIEKAKIVYKGGNMEIALKHFKEIVSSHKDIPEVHWYLAMIYNQLKIYENSEQSCLKVLALNKYSETISEYEVRKLLATLYFQQEKLDDAFKEYLHVNQIQPDDINVLYELGNISLKRNSFRDAIVYFEKYKKNSLDNPVAYYFLGMSYWKMGSKEMALENLNKSINLNKTIPEPHYYLGEIYRDQNNYDNAIKEYEIALGSKELKYQVELSMGLCFYKKNFYDQAIQHLKNALSGKFENKEEKCEIYYILADSYAKSGDLEQTIRNYEAIEKIEPEFKDAKKKLEYYRKLISSDVLHSIIKASDEEFVELAKMIIEKMNFQISEHNLNKSGVLDILAFEQNTKIKDNYLIEFIRFESSVGELTLRELHSKMQDMQVNRGICISASEFTPQAVSYTNNRSIQLIDKNELIKIFNRK